MFRKDHPRIEAYGTVDELNALLGKARSGKLPANIDSLLAVIQNELFDLVESATPDPAKHGTDLLGSAQIAALESAIDHHEASLEPLKQFILPGGTSEAAHLHLARTVCRRAERRLITLAAIETISADLIIYLNRLSDLLFVLARATNHLAGLPDIPCAHPIAEEPSPVVVINERSRITSPFRRSLHRFSIYCFAVQRRDQRHLRFALP